MNAALCTNMSETSSQSLIAVGWRKQPYTHDLDCKPEIYGCMGSFGA